jgi:DNA-binding transcriptional MocR family regulator
VSSIHSIRTTQVDTSEGMIDLAIGHPSPSLLPLDLIQRTEEERLPDRLRLSFSYHPPEALQAGVQRLAESISCIPPIV